MLNETVIINSRKADGEIHKSWFAELVSETDELLTFVGTFDKEINHPLLGIIRRGTVSYEFYWKQRWFNVFRFHEPEGNFRNFYCNINKPPRFENRILDYTDLDVDVLVSSDYSYQILDRDEFEANAVKYNYSAELRKTVEETLDELLSKIEKRSFPFDYKF